MAITLEEFIAGLAVRPCAAALFDLFYDALDVCGLADSPRLTLVRLCGTLAIHRFEETSTSLEVLATLRKGTYPLHPDDAPGPVVEAATCLARAARRILEATTRHAAARCIGEDLVPAVAATDTSLKRDRAARWLARWQRRYSGSVPHVVWEDPRGLCEVRLAFDGDFKTRIVATLLSEALDTRDLQVLDRARAGRMPDMLIVPVAALVGGRVYTVDLPPGYRPLREVFPDRVPVELAVASVIELAHAVGTFRRFLQGGFPIGPLSAWLAATNGTRITLHHLGLARALRDHHDCKGPMSDLPSAQEEYPGQVPASGPNDVFHLAAFLVTLLLGEGSIPRTVGFVMEGPQDDEIPLDDLPPATASVIRRCLRREGRPSLDELCQALAVPVFPLPSVHFRQLLNDLDERCTAWGGQVVERLIEAGERDRERLVAQYQQEALADLRRACDTSPETRPTQSVLQHIVLNRQAKAVHHRLNRACRVAYGLDVQDHRKRLTRAFSKLQKKDLATRQNFGDSLSDGIMRLFDDVRYGDIPRPRGWVLFSKGESRDCQDYGALHLSFGAMSGDPYEGCVIGGEVAGALSDEGLQVEWSGYRNDPIILPGFVWSAKARPVA